MSDDGGCPCHQSCHMAVVFFSLQSQNGSILQDMLMLPLEVVGPGGSLSTLLSPHLIDETLVGECPGGNGDGGIEL
jgi:hypothetical protein